MSLSVGAVITRPHYIPRLARFFHVPSVYRTAFHIPLRYIERYFTYLIVYTKAPCEWLYIRQHYYRFKLPRTLRISGDPTRIPYLYEKSPLVILLGDIHRKQHSERLLCTYPCGILWVAPSWQSWWDTELSELLLSFKFDCSACSLSRIVFWCVFSSFETLG